jgi:predicted enzyme related to lactoylglutathione lyase
MAVSIAHVTLDARDASALAAFWSAALERDVDDGATPEFASIGLGDGASGPAWLFARVPETKTAKNRMHLDFATADRGAEVARLEALGATALGEHEEQGEEWTVLADPEGNEFCVAQTT